MTRPMFRRWPSALSWRCLPCGVCRRGQCRGIGIGQRRVNEPPSLSKPRCGVRVKFLGRAAVAWLETATKSAIISATGAAMMGAQPAVWQCSIAAMTKAVTTTVLLSTVLTAATPATNAMLVVMTLVMIRAMVLVTLDVQTATLDLTSRIR